MSDKTKVSDREILAELLRRDLESAIAIVGQIQETPDEAIDTCNLPTRGVLTLEKLREVEVFNVGFRTHLIMRGKRQ